MTPGGGPTRTESLFEFFHVCPAGLVAFTDDGTIRLANPEAVNLLLPALGQTTMANLIDLMADSWPDLGRLLEAHSEPARIVQNHRIGLGTLQRPIHLAFTLVRVARDYNMVVVSDMTREVEAEEQRVLLLERERQARQRTELLERSATHLAAATTVDELAAAVLSDLTSALDTDIATVNIANGDEVRIIASDAAQDEADALGPGMLERYLRADINGALPGPEAIRTNTAIQLDTVDEIRARFPLVAEALQQHPVESLLATPLRSADGAVLGAIVVASQQPKWLDDAMLSLLGGIADQAGLALERAQLFEQVLHAREQEHAIALRLQTALLPEAIVDHPLLSVAAGYSAAGELLAVGGDWYDTFKWPSGHVGLMVGDVAGHDLDATAAMGRLRSSVAALAPLTGPHPAAILDALESLASGPDGSAFVTAACVVIDPHSRKLTYSTAGHPPPLVVAPDGDHAWLDQANAPPIGFDSAIVRSEAVVHAGTDSVVILYSDGLIERQGESLDIGLDRLAETAAASRHIQTGALPSELVAALTADTTAHDDIVVLAAKLLAPS